MLFYYQMKLKYIPLGCYWVKKIMTNHIPHATYLPVWEFAKKHRKLIMTIIVLAILVGLVLGVRDCMSKKEQEQTDSYTTDMPVEKSDKTDTGSNVKPQPIVKRPFIAFGKGTEAKITIEDTTKKHPEETKITVRGENPEVLTPKGSPLKVTIYREPTIRLIPSHPFAVGVMATYDLKKIEWGFLVKLQPLEIGHFGFSGWVGNQGYGFGVGYLHKGWSLDVLYNWRNQLIGLGLARKI